MTKAYSYIRFSSTRQIHGDSLRRQAELSARYAEEHNLELDTTINLRDLGLSAFDRSNIERGALGAFLKTVKDGTIVAGSYLLVESLDRLSRDQVLGALPIFLDILNHGIVIVTLADRQVYDHKVMADNPYALFGSISIMVRAHEESATKSRRLHASWTNKVKNAHEKKLTSRCPGWMQLSTDRKTFELIPERAAVVKEIIRLTQSGIGQWAISRQFNLNGVLNWSAKGVGWHISYVSKILNSPALYGEFQPHTRVDGKLQPLGEPISDYFPALISKDDFLTMRAARKRREFACAPKGMSVPNLFSGLVKCGYCGSTMSLVTAKPANASANKETRTYYRALVCEKGRRGYGCYAARWNYHDFELSFLTFCTGLELSTLVDEPLDQKVSARGMQAELQIVEAKLDDCNERLQRLISAIELGEATTTLMERVGALEHERHALQDQQSTLDTKIKVAHVEKRNQEAHFQSLQTLLQQMKHKQGDELFELRAALADHIRRIIYDVIVYPAGSIRSEATKERIRADIQDSTLSKDEIDAYIRSLRTSPERVGNSGRYLYGKSIDRHFIIQLRSGLASPIFPDFDDPTKLGECSPHISPKPALTTSLATA